MKTIYDRLNKVYDKTLLDQKDIRKHYRTICDLLEEYQIPHDEKSDDAVIQNEIVYESLLVKRQFEDVFLIPGEHWWRTEDGEWCWII